MNKRYIGTIGEYISCEYLKDHDYDIVDRNFYCREGEIDIVAIDKNRRPEEYCFIEVKLRSSEKYGRPASAITEIKKKHLLNASKYYIYKKRVINKIIRYDVIEVYNTCYLFLSKLKHYHHCNRIFHFHFYQHILFL